MNFATTLVLTLFIAFCWGGQTMIHKYLLKTFSPYTMLVVGSGFYLACLFVFAIVYWPKIKIDIPKISWKLLSLVLVSSIICGFIANLVYYFVLSKNQSYVVSSIISCAPLFTLLLAWMFLRENVTVLSVIAVGLIVLGVALLAY